MSLPDTLSNIRRIDGGFATAIPEDWMQGRTSYGGFSAALALEAARGLAPDLPPLRSAQVSFVGPLSGEVEVRARMLRRGKNAGGQSPAKHDPRQHSLPLHPPDSPAPGA